MAPWYQYSYTLRPGLMISQYISWQLHGGMAQVGGARRQAPDPPPPSALPLPTYWGHLFSWTVTVTALIQPSRAQDTPSTTSVWDPLLAAWGAALQCSVDTCSWDCAWTVRRQGGGIPHHAGPGGGHRRQQYGAITAWLWRRCHLRSGRWTHAIHNFSPLLAFTKLTCTRGYTHIQIIYPKLCDLTSDTDDRWHIS
jgi:hypothetical protein